MIEIYDNFVDGKWGPSGSGETYPQKDPADLTQVTGLWPKSTVEDVRKAIDVAERAFEAWRSLTIYKRAEYLKKSLMLMQQRVDQIACVITTENGKTLSESKSEIISAIKEMDFQINEGLRSAGQVMPSERDGVIEYHIRRPLGVVAVIAPWNFPFNVPCRKITPALIAGNTCVFKPSNLTPGVGAEFVKLYEEAELPAGVLNFVTGPGSVIGNELVSHPAIKAVSFTGSTEVGMAIHKKAADNLIRTQLEMGGKNPLVVLADANLEEAADAAVLAAYACAGQWCTSTSRVIVEKSVVDDFCDLLLRRVKKIVVGKGADAKTTMGPVCGENQLKNILAGIERGKAEGAQLLFGGTRLIEGDLIKGCFISPAIFFGVSKEMFLAQEEIFGPVLSIMTADDFEQTIEMANAVRFGLSSSIYTNNLQKAMTFVERTDVGLTHVNIHTAFKEPQLSFGGIKRSGHGLPEAGRTGIEFFTEHKVVYIKYRPGK
ncbi:MAG: aldehyde dehydrogenase family protein [Phycisphaerae bacterium]